MKNPLQIIWALLFAAVIIMGGTYFFGKTDEECAGGVVIAGGNDGLGGSFNAIDHTGKPVTDQDVITGLSLLYFGYTFCPDVCPIDTARNAEIANILSERNVDITPVFITVDPERDTPEVMADFVAYTHPEMIGITGSNEEIDALKKAYKVYAEKQPSEDEYYLIDHTAFSYLVAPDGLRTVFSRSQSAEEIADIIACYAK